MNILGLFQGIDPAACLLRDGELVSFVEEERLIRVKHAAGVFPVQSIEYCLTSAGMNLGECCCQHQPCTLKRLISIR